MDWVARHDPLLHTIRVSGCGDRVGAVVGTLGSGRLWRELLMVVAAILVAQLAVVSFPLPVLPSTASRAFADPSAPASPPAAVNPAPVVQVVSTPGPTQAPSQ